MTEPSEFCKKMREWAALMTNAERIANGKSFAKAWQEVEIAIRKSCLLSRTLYSGENPSQTPCPVHKGKWSGLHCGWPGAMWVDKDGNRTPVKEESNLREWYEAGCRCFQHKCGCTTGWQPDEHCGCLATRQIEP